MEAKDHSVFRRVIRYIDDKFEEIIGVVVLATVVTLVFAGVTLRLTLKSGMPWQEEISRILYVLVIYLGASFGMKSRDHIRITFLVNMLPMLGQKIMRIITDIIWAGFNIIIIVISIRVYQNMQRFLGESAVLKIPLHYIFLIIPVGFALLTLRLIQGYIQRKGQPALDVPLGEEAGER
jgi:TRAP-type C4-dicarboxylate transport system permease small subunit